MMDENISYNKDLFIQPPNEILECPICFDIMKDPVQCPTQGHTFCRHCVTQHLDLVSKTCPTCRKPLKTDKLTPNRLICTLIEDADVYCYSYLSAQKDKAKAKKRKIGDAIESCEWSGKLKDRDIHYNQCQFAKMRCTHSDCEEIVIRKDLPGHKKDCIHRLVKCDWCDLLDKIGIIGRHKPICQKRPGPCPNECVDAKGNLKLFLPGGMANHRKSCALESVECAFVITGYKIKLQRKDMALHEKDAGAHMACILKALQSDQNKISTLEKVSAEQGGIIKADQKKISVFEKALYEQRLNIEGQQEEIERLDSTLDEQRLTIEAQAEEIERLNSTIEFQTEEFERLDSTVNSQIIYSVPVSQLYTIMTSQTVNIGGHNFNLQLKTQYPNYTWHSLTMNLVGDSNRKLDCTVTADISMISESNPQRTISRSLTHKFLSPTASGSLELVKTSDFQNPVYVKEGHITIIADFTAVINK